MTASVKFISLRRLTGEKFPADGHVDSRADLQSRELLLRAQRDACREETQGEDACMDGIHVTILVVG